MRGLTLCIGEADNGVTVAKLFPWSVDRAKYAALCPQTISTPPLGSTAIRGTGALLPEAIPFVFDTFTGAVNALPPVARLLKKMSPPPPLFVPAHATYTPAELTATCGCEPCAGKSVVATVSVLENATPPAGECRKRMAPESSHTTLISPLGPTAIEGITAWPVSERFMGTVRKLCARTVPNDSAIASTTQSIGRICRKGTRSMLRKISSVGDRIGKYPEEPKRGILPTPGTTLGIRGSSARYLSRHQMS